MFENGPTRLVAMLLRVYKEAYVHVAMALYKVSLASSTLFGAGDSMIVAERRSSWLDYVQGILFVSVWSCFGYSIVLCPIFYQQHDHIPQAVIC